MSAAALVAQLASAGTPPELLAAVAEQLFHGEIAQKKINERRAKDRERKAVPQNSEEIHGTPRNSTNSAEFHNGSSSEVSPAPLPTTISISPTPPKGVVAPKDEKPKPLSRREILEAWQQRMVPLGFPAVAKMTAMRNRQLDARLKDSTLEEWQRAMDALERSAFCRGENDRGWKADFDFLLQPKSFTKLLEGSYDH